MDTTRICLVRHGETDWNLQVRLQGHEDIPLNAQGIAQAQATAAALAGQPFSAVYTSDLGRARHTAELIASRYSGLRLSVDVRLRERHFGGLQGLTREAAELRYPGLNTRVRNREIDLAPPDGGETLRAFATRVEEALDTIAACHAGSNVLVVTHGGCLDVIYRRATGKPLNAPRDFPLGNAALNWVAHSKGKWQLLVWDERSHLDEVQDDLPV